MTFTITLTELSFFIIAVSFLVLVVSIIPALLQLRQTGRALQEFAEEGKTVLSEVKEITRRVNGQVAGLDEAVRSVSNVTLKAAGLAEALIDTIRVPAVTIAGLIAGVGMGFKHFRKGGEKDVRE